MPDQLDPVSKKLITDFLPNAISKALQSYETFIAASDDSDAKKFSVHHTSCKVAIAHLELLLKLARWIEPQEADENNEVLYNLVHLAEQRIEQNKGADIDTEDE